MNPLEEIKKITEQITNVKDISIKSSKTELVRARCIYFTLAKKELDYSNDTIALYINQKRNACSHAGVRFDKYLFQSDLFKRNYNKVSESFKQLKEADYIVNGEVKEIHNKYAQLKSDYDTVIKKQRKDRRKLLVFLRTEHISTRLVDISKDLNSTQIEQMFERMEQFAKMCNYHNQKKKVL